LETKSGHATLDFVNDPKRLLEEALHLPAEERAALAGALIESLDLEIDEDVEAAWSSEIGARGDCEPCGASEPEVCLPLIQRRPREDPETAGCGMNVCVSARSSADVTTSARMAT
jgi:Putative addiction module component